MKLPVYFRPEANDDIESTTNWYETERAGLGQRFLSHLADAVDRIVDHPQFHGIVWEDVRFARLTKFPYVVYFRILADKIEILAVMHGSRDSTASRVRAGNGKSARPE